MTPTTKAVPALSEGQRTILSRCRENLSSRFLNHYLNAAGDLVIHYRTSAGYYVSASYGPNGAWNYNEYYRHWNEIEERPFGFLFKRF